VGASSARLVVEQRDAQLHLSICDDGIGGTDPARGSGLIGLSDRVQALGGSIEISSPRGAGTAILVGTSAAARPTTRSTDPAAHDHHCNQRSNSHDRARISTGDRQ
jgi:signal transduction histidine kinase